MNRRTQRKIGRPSLRARLGAISVGEKVGLRAGMLVRRWVFAGVYLVRIRFDS